MTLSIRDAFHICPDMYVARRLLMEVLGVSQEDLLIYESSFLSKDQYKTFTVLCDRIKKGEPLAYVLGYEFFYGLSFTVNNHVLIPRPETEVLVTLAGKHIEKHHGTILFDVGTGSGCVGISVMYSWGVSISQCFLVDISFDALVVARENAMNILPPILAHKIHYQNSDLLSFLIDNQPLRKEREILIVANLPYIPVGYIGTETSVSIWEPGLALYSGDDGLNHYHRLMRQILYYELKAIVMMEMMTWQVENMKKWLDTYIEYSSWVVYPTFHENICIVEVHCI